ncbi:MAG: hypothetical protein R6X09_06260, partial [Bacteroidales bacterium]
LGNYFANISLYRYSDSLIVTDSNLLTDYILSGRIELVTAMPPAEPVPIHREDIAMLSVNCYDIDGAIYKLKNINNIHS